MGLFDYIKFEQPLINDPSGTNFQTKDFDCLMDHYVVSVKGELYLECWDTEIIEKPDSFAGFYINNISGSYRREYLTEYTGLITFYNTHTDEYVAKFIDGKLRSITFKSREWMNDTVLQQHTTVRQSDPRSGSEEREASAS